MVRKFACCNEEYGLKYAPSKRFMAGGQPFSAELDQFHPQYNTSNLDALVAEAGVTSWPELMGIKGGFFNSHGSTADPRYNPEFPVIGPYVITIGPQQTTTALLYERNPYYWMVDTAGNQLPLNPRKTVLQIVGESLRRHDNIRGVELEQRVAELLRRVGLRPEYIRRYPHAFSGGERQRIGVARALALRPRLVITDEAVSALDVSVQAQILNLLQELQTEFDLTYLFVAHDLSVVDYISDRVAVMYVASGLRR